MPKCTSTSTCTSCLNDQLTKLTNQSDDPKNTKYLKMNKYMCTEHIITQQKKVCRCASLTKKTHVHSKCRLNAQITYIHKAIRSPLLVHNRLQLHHLLSTFFVMCFLKNNLHTHVLHDSYSSLDCQTLMSWNQSNLHVNLMHHFHGFLL